MKSLKSLIVLLLAAATIAATSCSGSKKSVTLKLAGAPGTNKMLVVYQPLDESNPRESTVRDTMMCVDGKLTIQLPKDKKDYTVLLIMIDKLKDDPAHAGEKVFSGGGDIRLIVKKRDKIKVIGTYNDTNFLTFTTNGTKFNSEYAEQKVAARDAILRHDSAIYAVHAAIANNEPKEKVKEQKEAALRAAEAITAIQEEYVKNNPGSDLSVYYVARNYFANFEELEAGLNPEMKEGLFKHMLEQTKRDFAAKKISEEAKKSAVNGGDAPEVVLTNLNGELVKLSKIAQTKEYIVVDFWGSWCHWCIVGVPQMKNYYKKYNSRIEFVGVACNDTADRWRATVKKYEMNWTQLFAPMDAEPGDNVAALYGVSSFPTKFIIDKEMQIVGRYEGETPEFYARIDALMK